IFIRAGYEDIEEKTFHYLSNSLFDISVDSGIGSESIDPNKNEKSRDKNGNVDENYGVRRFGAVFMDYLCVEDTASKEPSEDVDIELSTNQADIFSLYFIFYSVEINVSANLVHRLCKIYECCLNHQYTEPYSRFQKLKSESNSSFVESVESVDQIGTQSPIKKARQFEKHTPIRMTNFIFKQPLIKFYPYSHFLIAPIASQDVNFECFFKLDLNYLYFNITRPVDEKSLFDVVSKLPSPSKKLVYDSYTHNQFTVRVFLFKKKKISYQKIKIVEFFNFFKFIL
ncbi:vacuolar sorting-associated 13B isoform X1, partial [Brachionus plicatilis]